MFIILLMPLFAFAGNQVPKHRMHVPIYITPVQQVSSYDYGYWQE